ncbi:MAG: hypothetical protein ABWU16_03200 [Halothiobacillaceae bacterium]
MIKIGGEVGVHALTRRFYAVMRELPSTRALLSIHRDLDDSKRKLFEFLSG